MNQNRKSQMDKGEGGSGQRQGTSGERMSGRERMRNRESSSNDLGSSSDRAMMTGRSSEARDVGDEAGADGNRSGSSSERGRGSSGERNLGSESERSTPRDRGARNRQTPDPLPEREP